MSKEGIASVKLPAMTDEMDKTFWEEVQKERFLLQTCLDCGELQFPPAPVCRRCFSNHLDWKEAKGTGTVYSFTPIYVPISSAFRKSVETSGKPIIHAYIDLDDQVRIVTEIIDCGPEEVNPGARVSMTFPEIPGTNFKIPKCQLIK